MDPDEPATLGSLIRAARRTRRLTIEELSARAGIGARTLGDLERDRIARPHRRTVEALAGTLGLDQTERAALRAAARPATPAQPTLAIGRGQESRLLYEWLCRWSREQAAAATMVLYGPPGVGKTAFARRIGEVYRDLFPGGRRWLDLGGTTAPEPGQRSPSALLVLDAAMDEAQVRPLIGGRPGVTVVVARRPLSGLAADRLVLGELTPADAPAVLAAMIDPDRIAAEPAAAAELARLCGYLPLALRIVAARLTAHPRMTLDDAVGRLRPPDERLSWLAAGDLRMRDVLAGHYEELPDRDQTAFRRLCVLRGTTVTTAAAAALFGLHDSDAEAMLDRLVDAGVLTAGDAAGRYRLTALLRLFGREMLAAREPSAVIERLLAAASPG